MKAITFQQFGSSTVLQTTDVKKPTPEAHQVLIRVEYTSINPVDWKIREGYLSRMIPHSFPVIPGWDVAGTIEAIGSDVADFAPGDRVFAYARKAVVSGGTYAEYVTVAKDALARIPASIRSSDAASIPLVGLTAWQALHDVGRLDASDTVLVSAGAGGVGSFAIQLARHAGARVVTTASSRNHGYVMELGADAVVDYNAEDAIEQLRAAAPDGYSLILDAAGGTALEQAWQVIRRGGRLVSIVSTPDADRARAAGIQGDFHFVSPNGRQLARLGELVASGRVMIPALSIRNIREAANAQDDNQGRHVRGKVVLKVDFTEQDRHRGAATL